MGGEDRRGLIQYRSQELRCSFLCKVTILDRRAIARHFHLSQHVFLQLALDVRVQRIFGSIIIGFIDCALQLIVMVSSSPIASCVEQTAFLYWCITHANNNLSTRHNSFQSAPLRHLRLGDVNSLADHQTSMQDEHSDDRVELENGSL